MEEWSGKVEAKVQGRKEGGVGEAPSYDIYDKL